MSTGLVVSPPSGAPAPRDPGPDPSGRRPLRRFVVAVVLTVIVLGAFAVGAWVTASRFESPEQRAAAATPPAAEPVTAAVGHGTLAQQVTASGTVMLEHPVDVAVPTGDGASVVTSHGAEAGAEIGPGTVLLTVNGRPLLAFPGAFPAYRDLRPGDTGPDVAQLQAGLRAAGYTVPEREDGRFGAGTARAVTRLYRDRGSSVPTETAAVTPTTVSATGEDAAAPATTATAAPTLVVPAAELLFASTLPATLVQLPAVGTVLDPTISVVTLADGSLVARTGVAPSIAIQLTAGTTGTLTGPDGSALAVRVTAVQPGDATTGESGSVDLAAVEGAVPTGWLGSAVLVTLDIQVVAEDALLVPSRAVAQSGTGTTQVVVRRGDGFAIVPVVELGTLAGQSAVRPVTAGDLAEGDQVQVG